jgi:hypothetical protein
LIANTQPSTTNINIKSQSLIRHLPPAWIQFRKVILIQRLSIRTSTSQIPRIDTSTPPEGSVEDVRFQWVKT